MCGNGLNATAIEGGLLRSCITTANPTSMFQEDQIVDQKLGLKEVSSFMWMDVSDFGVQIEDIPLPYWYNRQLNFSTPWASYRGYLTASHTLFAVNWMYVSWAWRWGSQYDSAKDALFTAKSPYNT